MHDTSFTVHIKDEIPTYIFFIDTSGGATNLVEALKLGEVTITNFCMNQKNYFVLLTDGVPTDDPEPIIQKLILKVISIIYINKK
ncbi:hypothetical protein DDB_G0278175 [Dictyostelium discoideum AX4]|uniref:VWFA domain-containing protein n=1 Tax=Dictyostelium discoideum TaxID=44689 RepID=Q54YM1_DICDI|nr:hypothetical protein DDB_G0278175 [Dictyostelium discoideum AX4]EAL68260.1 hypothetical protein DDB_G0278175 [Dictyostelium discoideum AX4]|eukprot:XP_642181.1 hypothetical protein DDB_G0278175 [Dictyostelium discoideum AX4]